MERMRSMDVVALVIAALAGVTMAIQGSLNSILGKIIGLWEANLIVHIIGTVTVGIILFVLRLGDGNILDVGNAPWYTLLGGILSALIIYGVANSIPKLGVAVATTSIIVGQVLTASLVDHLGLFGLKKIPFNWYQLLGILLLAIGARILLNSNS